jgi:hypothetical protein
VLKHESVRVFNFAFEVEHIHPHRLGGTDALANLALACESCNLYKGSVIARWDEEAQQTVTLFHPRQQVWEEHFEWDSLTEMILGKTPTGRATVQQLRFNSDFQRRARQLWLQMGLFP